MDNQVTSTKRPLDYIKVIFRRKWFLIIPMAIGIIGGTISGNVLPKAYRASTLILVEEGRVINPLIQGLAVSTSTAQRLAILPFTANPDAAGSVKAHRRRSFRL